jgi:hypothetical protein
MLDQLKTERAALFLPSGTKPALNQQIGQLLDLRKEARRRQVSLADYKKQQKEIEQCPQISIAHFRDAAQPFLAAGSAFQSQVFWKLMPWPGSRFSPGSALGRPIMGFKGEALQRVNRPFPRRDNGQQPAHSRFIPPSRSGQRLRECGAGTMDWDQAVAVSLVQPTSGNANIST